MLTPNTPDQAIMAQELEAFKGSCSLFRAMLVKEARLNLITGNVELIAPNTANMPKVLDLAKVNIADHCVLCSKVLEHKPQAAGVSLDGDGIELHPTVDVLTSQSIITENLSEF